MWRSVIPEKPLARVADGRDPPAYGHGGVVLEVRGATRRFAHRVALAGVDLTLRSGELYALLGPNGSGKTSLLRAIAGRLRLDAGRVDIEGRNPLREPESRRMLGVVPQAIALYPHLSVRENLEVLGRLAGVPRRGIGDAVEQALEWTGLRSRAADLAGTLSGGMQRRLNVAAGTLHRPRVLLLDEPTVGIDAPARDAIHEMLSRLKAQGLSILLTTHDLDQASELADRVGILAAGRMLAEGPPAALVRQTFGEGRELIITLAARPDERGRTALADESLEPIKDGMTWKGPLVGDLAGLSEVGRRITRAGLVVSEIRVREPGLRGVVAHFTGEEMGP